MKRNILPGIMLLIVALVSIALFFIFNVSYKVHSDTIPQIIYWLAKGFSLMTLAFIGYFIYKKVEIANILILVRLTVIWQFIPLFIRLLLLEDKDPTKILFPSIILAIALLGYIGIFFLLIESNKRIKEKMPEFEGKITKPAESKSYYDDNNNFIGANARNEEEDE